jgi:hypothetical protein
MTKANIARETPLYARFKDKGALATGISIGEIIFGLKTN